MHVRATSMLTEPGTAEPKPAKPQLPESETVEGCLDPNEPIAAERDLGSASENVDFDEDWIEEHYRQIHRAAWLMTGDAWAAEDLAQETFVVALDRRDSFQGRSSLSTWLYGILLRLHQRRGRSLARMRRRLAMYVQRWDADKPPPTNDPQTQLAEDQWKASVWADVARLPESQRAAVTLRFAEGMSYQQIAESVGCAVGTAKSRVHHGLTRLRRWRAVEDQYSSASSPDATTSQAKTENTKPNIQSGS